MIKRHHTHMEKLLAEKEDLSQKCAALTEEVKVLRKQFEDKVGLILPFDNNEFPMPYSQSVVMVIR